MNYKLELNTESDKSHIVFNTILFDSFKINIIDRYKRNKGCDPILCDTIFKVRTIDDQLVKTNKGNNRVKLKDSHQEQYQKLVHIINSYQYRNKLIKQKQVDEDYVHFMLSLFLSNYQFH